MSGPQYKQLIRKMLPKRVSDAVISWVSSCVGFRAVSLSLLALFQWEKFMHFRPYHWMEGNQAFPTRFTIKGAEHIKVRVALKRLSLSCAGKPTASESARGGAGRGYVRHYAFQVRYHEIRHSGEEDAERSCLRGRRPTRTLAEDLTSVALAQVQIMYPAKFMLEAGESTPVITAGPEEAQKRGTGARTRGNMEGVALGTPAHRLGP
eukprot:scaffold131_cov381-Pinguiococcus_pyrenoidosus.AAC.7